MKFNIKTIAVVLSVLLLLTTSNMASVKAATASASSGSVDVGKTITITVSFKDNNIGAVYGSFSFDPSALRYESGSNTSNGRIAAVAGSSGASSINATMTFTALKAGTHSVKISGSEILDFDGNSLGSASTSANVTVKAPAPPPTTDPKPTTPTKPKPTAPKPTTPVVPEVDPMDDAIELTVGSEKLYLWPKLVGIKIPEGFEKGDSKYKEGSIEAAKKEPLTLAYLTDEEGKNGAFWNYDEKDQSFYPYVKIATQSTYVFLQPGEDIVVPEGYEETSVTIDEQTLNGWAIDDPELKDFVLLYALNNEAEEGFYLYDKVEGTMQRYGERIVEVEVEVEVEPEPQTITQQIFGNPILAGIFSGLGLLAAGLAAALIRVIQKNKRNT